MNTNKRQYAFLYTTLITIIIIIGIFLLLILSNNNNNTSVIEKHIIVKSPPEIITVYRHPLQRLEWNTDIEMKVNRNSRICLAKNIFFEARGESIMGMIAVGQVTINRLHTGKWGANICSVVYSPGQFSWTIDRNARQSVPGHKSVLRGDQWELSLVAADLVLRGIRIPIIQNALYYHNIFVTPNWSQKYEFITRIEQHLFYYEEEKWNNKK